jgi:glycosyltransferase involved in cell wall biosynthesis
MSDKKISIITITLNAERYLEQTIASVVNQTHLNRECIIVDGGSTDGTLDIIKKYESEIDNWISEPDNGIADAMNKGIDLATGDYILFLHSDDYLVNSSVLERASEYLGDRFDIFFFQVLHDIHGQNQVSSNRPLGWLTNFKMGSCHQGQLCSRKLFQRIGKFDTSFKIDMDYDLILRAYRAGASCNSVNMPLAVMRLVGISSRTDWKSLRERFDEERRVHFKNCTTIWMRLLYIFYWMMYLPYRKSLHALNPNKKVFALDTFI